MAHALSKLFWLCIQKAVADRLNLLYSSKRLEEAVSAEYFIRREYHDFGFDINDRMVKAGPA